jgi:predicted RNase H-like nuclease (RuvC/YqgF family)
VYSIDIKNNKEIYDYCMHNGITDINKFVQDCFKQGYDIKKYGLLGKPLDDGEKDLIKEVIVEKQVEVEKIVEVIKEVEKIVTNVEYIRDENIENQLNEKLKLLQETLQNLRTELQQKNEQIKELEKINRDLLNGNQNQAYLLRGSNLNRRI